MTDNFPNQTNLGKTVNVAGDNAKIYIDGRIFTEPKVTHNFPNSLLNIYGRKVEADLLRETLCGKTPESQAKRFALITAPSGFGKSVLLAKTLREVAVIDAIKPAYQAEVNRILMIDCGSQQSLSAIVGDFNSLLGTQEVYNGSIDAVNFSRQLVQLAADKVWLILDNFEQWLNANDELLNDELQAFLNALFDYGNLRGVILSQSPPANFILRQLNVLDSIDATLYRGLPESDALQMLRIEGKSVGLDCVDEKLLLDFLAKVAYIPQALNSLLGYMSDGIKLDEVLKIPEFAQGFDNYESDAEKLKNGERRTKALINRQIDAQSDEVKLLLQALSFFDRKVSSVALEALFPNPVDARKFVKRLQTHRLALLTFDLQQIGYYELHNYFSKQSRSTLLKFEEVFDIKSYADNLFITGYDQDSHHFLTNAVNLYECSEKIYEYLNLHYDLASAYVNKGVSLDSLGKLNEAIIEYDKAILIRTDLVDSGQSELANYLAGSYMNKGNSLDSLGKLNEAIIEYDKAILTLTDLVESGQSELVNDLAMAYINKGVSLYSLGKVNEAIIEFDKAIQIFKSLVESGQSEQANYLASAYDNKGEALAQLEKVNEAIIEFDKAIQILSDLVDRGRSEFTNDLALSYINKGNALDSLDKLNEAIEFYDDAINLWEETLQRGEFQNLPNIAMASGNRLITHRKAGNADLAEKDMSRLYELLEFTKQHKEIEHFGEYIQRQIDKRS